MSTYLELREQGFNTIRFLLQELQDVKAIDYSIEELGNLVFLVVVKHYDAGTITIEGPWDMVYPAVQGLCEGELNR